MVIPVCTATLLPVPEDTVNISGETMPYEIQQRSRVMLSTAVQSLLENTGFKGALTQELFLWGKTRWARTRPWVLKSSEVYRNKGYWHVNGKLYCLKNNKNQ